MSTTTEHDGPWTETPGRPGTRLYAWTAEGEPATGTLADYASHLQHAAHADVEIGPLYRLREHNGRYLTLDEVTPERTITEGDDFRHIVLSHEDQDATYRIDLRA